MHAQEKTAFKHRWLTLRSKFMMMFVVLITIPFAISAIVFYAKYSTDTKQSSRSYMQQIMNQVTRNLEWLIADADRITIAPLYDEFVIKTMENHKLAYLGADVFLSSSETSRMNRIVSSLITGRSEIKNLMLFTQDGGLFSLDDERIFRSWDKHTNEWMSKADKAGGGLVVIPPHTVTYYRSEPQRVISVARALIHPATGEQIGMIKLDFHIEVFEAMLSEVWLGDRSLLVVKTEDGSVLFPDKEVQYPEPILLNEDELLYWRNEEYVWASTSSYQNGLQVLGITPTVELNQGAKEIVNFVAMISVTALIAAYFLAIVSSNRLVRPIRYLQSKMRLVQAGMFGERADLKRVSQDEIGQLALGFNTMIEEVNRLVRVVYETELREREAELSALQSQINPHFLYNTLELISMKALQRGGLDIHETVISLGQMLRYTVDKQEKPVALQDELRFVSAYLHIQSSRLEQRLHFEQYVDPSYEACLVPKLILQPLFENAIEHGMQDGRAMTLRIAVESEEEQMRIVVLDDGIGMTDEKRESVINSLRSKILNEQCPGYGGQQKGYGLRNVHQRLRLLYGDEYGLELDQSHIAGTKWIIKLPMKWEE